MKKIDKKEIIRAIKFLLFSASAGIIQIGSFALMDLLTNWDYVLKSYIAVVLSVLWNFTFNRKFTFKSASNVPIAMAKTFAYYLVFAPLSIHLGDMYLVKTLGWNEILIQAITMLINFVTEFLYQRFFVFKNSLDTNVKSKETKEQNKV
ncbi:MAG: GtrA family protein [Clostridia bacterium]|nr:GtrA family protein [Clostridia bacterium]